MKAAGKLKDNNVPGKDDHDETGIEKAITTSVVAEDAQCGNGELIAIKDSAAEPDTLPNKHNSYEMPTVGSDINTDRTSSSVDAQLRIATSLTRQWIDARVQILLLRGVATTGVAALQGLDGGHSRSSFSANRVHG